VGYVGDTGYSDGEHLHLEVRKCSDEKDYVMGKTGNKKTKQEGKGLSWGNCPMDILDPFNHTIHY